MLSLSKISYTVTFLTLSTLSLVAMDQAIPETDVDDVENLARDLSAIDLNTLANPENLHGSLGPRQYLATIPELMKSKRYHDLEGLFIDLTDSDNLKSLRLAYQELADYTKALSLDELQALLNELITDQAEIFFPAITCAVCLTMMRKFNVQPIAVRKNTFGQNVHSAPLSSIVNVAKPDDIALFPFASGEAVIITYSESGYTLIGKNPVEIKFLLPLLQPIYGICPKVLTLSSLVDDISDLITIRQLSALEELHLVCSGITLPEWLTELPCLHKIVVFRSAKIPQALQNHPRIKIEYLQKISAQDLEKLLE